MTSPTPTAYPGEFTITIFHDYKWEWEEVADDYVAQEGEFVATNIRGRKARRYNNTNSDRSWTTFQGYGLQQIHDDRFETREVMAEAGVTFAVKPDLQIIAQHLSDGVLPELTDVTAITSFACDTYPAIASYLNLTYGLTP